MSIRINQLKIIYIRIKIKWADSKSFEVIKDNLARDNNNCYRWDEIIDMEECEKISNKN